MNIDSDRSLKILSHLQSLLEEKKLDRRTFLRLLGGGGLATILFLLNKTNPVLSQEKEVEVAEALSALDELGTDHIIKTFHEINAEGKVITPASRIAENLFKKSGEVSAADAENILAEPVSKLISTSEGTETESNGVVVSFREYLVEYRGVQFKIKAKVLNSADYPNTLDIYFNAGTDRETFQNKQVTALTFNSDSPVTDSLNKVTIYCLQSYDVNDPEINLFALDQQFFASDPANSQRKILREVWTALQFAQGFNPDTLNYISNSAGIPSFNNVRRTDGGKEIKNATLIISNKWGGNGSSANMYNPEDTFSSDAGALFNSALFGDTIQFIMHGNAALFAHEMAHSTAVVYYTGKPARGLMASFTGLSLSENQAEMCRANFWKFFGNEGNAKYLYTRTTEKIFQANATTKEFHFQEYVPLVTAMSMLPYAEMMKVVLNNQTNLLGMDGKISTAGLCELNIMYMQLRDQMFISLNSDWYMQWREKKFPINSSLNQAEARTHHDLYAPLIYAQYLSEGKNPAANAATKAAFMEDVLVQARQLSLPTRARMLSEAFTRTDTIIQPYLQTALEVACENIVSGIAKHSTPLEVPGLAENRFFKRRQSEMYANSTIAAEDEYLYREFYPNYSLSKLDPAPEGQSYYLEKTSRDQDFLVVVIEYHYDENEVLVSEVKVARQNERVTITPTTTAIIGVVDLRTTQLQDELNAHEVDIFRLAEQTFDSSTLPTATPQPEVTATSEPGVTATPDPFKVTPTPGTPQPTPELTEKVYMPLIEN